MSDGKTRGLRLIEGDAIETVEILGSTFKVAVQSNGAIEDLRAAHSTNGVLDRRAYNDALWRASLVGWSGLYDGKGDEIPFSADAVQRVRRGIPQHVAERLLTVAAGGSALIAAALGN